ncbi:MAG: twin-arginine translocase subunit TatC [Phycisphaeraceae bacterium]|nr:twin-arginine translocase subunit TatC [Phycisphaeraceae bacterium]
MNSQSDHEARMSLGEHLEELRWRIILGLIGPLVFTIVLLFFGWEIVAFICEPLQVRLLAEGYEPQVYNMSVTSAFGVYLKVCLIGGLVIGLPWFAMQMWRFIAPGLLPHEKRVVNSLWIPSIGLTALGVAFMYYVMLPITLWFLISFSAKFPAAKDLSPNELESRLTRTEDPNPDRIRRPDEPKPVVIPVRKEAPEKPLEGEIWIDKNSGSLRMVKDGRVLSLFPKRGQLMAPMIPVDGYISFVIFLALAFAISFQLPLVMMVLGWLGLIRHEQLTKIRGHALLGCFVVGMLLTPADIFSQFALAVPMYILYEVGIVLVWYFQKKRPDEDGGDDSEGGDIKPA